MERTITGFHLDEESDWVAELSCGHNQHVRHQPPFRLRPWVVDPDQRAARVGALLECPPCDRAELPEELYEVRSSPIWDEQSIPAGLLRAHRLVDGTWGEIRVHEGRLRFVMVGDPNLELVVEAEASQAIPPEVPHHVEPLGSVRFSITFLTTERLSGHSRTPDRRELDGERSGGRHTVDEGGDPACWAGLICPECGSVVDGSPHRSGCPRGSPS